MRGGGVGTTGDDVELVTVGACDEKRKMTDVWPGTSFGPRAKFSRAILFLSFFLFFFFGGGVCYLSLSAEAVPLTNTNQMLAQNTCCQTSLSERNTRQTRSSEVYIKVESVAAETCWI